MVDEQELTDNLKEWSSVDSTKKDFFTRNKVAREIKRIVTSWGNWKKRDNPIKEIKPLESFLVQYAAQYGIPKDISIPYLYDLLDTQDLSNLYGNDRKMFFDIMVIKKRARAERLSSVQKDS